MMKKVLYVGFLLAFLSIAMYSCLEESCSFCREVTRESDGSVIEQGSDIEFCGSELDSIEFDTEPVTIGGVTTKWECD